MADGWFGAADGTATDVSVELAEVALPFGVFRKADKCGLGAVVCVNILQDGIYVLAELVSFVAFA